MLDTNSLLNMYLQEISCKFYVHLQISFRLCKYNHDNGTSLKFSMPSSMTLEITDYLLTL